jgi:hypothetical protein
MPIYHFPITIVGDGDTSADAWEDAIANFWEEPGDYPADYEEFPDEPEVD